jgi:hypothetical protein
MSQFHTYDQSGGVDPVQIPGYLDQVGNENMNVGGVGMIGNGNGLVTENLDSTDMLRRDEGTVTEESVRMKINHVNTTL